MFDGKNRNAKGRTDTHISAAEDVQICGWPLGISRIRREGNAPCANVGRKNGGF